MNASANVAAIRSAAASCEALQHHSRANTAIFPDAFPSDTRLVELIRSAKANGDAIMYLAQATHRVMHDEASAKALTDATRAVAAINRQAALAESFIDYLSLARDLAEEVPRQESTFPGVRVDGWMAVLSGRATTLLRRVFA